MENEFDSININIEWLNNIYGELRIIQDIERLAREGCKNLMEYMQTPINSQRLVLADVQYKNMRFFALELDILIRNLAPIIPKKIDSYVKRLNPILDNLNKRNLFVEERKINNRVVEIYTLSFLYKTIDFLISIKSDIIKDIGHILYLKQEDIGKKKWQK